MVIPKTVLMEQVYPGLEDYITHFDFLLPAFKDPRYFKVNGKITLFMVYKTYGNTRFRIICKYFQTFGIEDNGLEGIHLVYY